MSVTLNAKGTSTSSFKVGKNGTIITQGGVISPPAATDLTIDLDSNRDLLVSGSGDTPALRVVNPTNGTLSAAALLVENNAGYEFGLEIESSGHTGGIGNTAWLYTLGPVPIIMSVNTDIYTPVQDFTLNTDGNAIFLGSVTASSFIGPLTGNVTGSASLNVLKAGDTMTGDLLLVRTANTLAGVHVTNSSSGTSASADFLLTNNAGKSVGIEVTSSAYTGFANQGWIYTDGSIPLNLSTGSSPQITLATTGNVTINAPSSGATLTATPVSGGVAFKASVAAATQVVGLQIAQTGQQDWQIYQPASSGDLRFFAGADRLVISATGNVAITSGAGSPLAVAGPAATAWAALFSSGSTTGANYVNLTNTSGSGLFGIESSTGSALLAGASAYSTVVTSGTQQLHFGTNGALRLTINTAGNVSVLAPSSGLAMAISGNTGGVLSLDNATDTRLLMKVGGVTQGALEAASNAMFLSAYTVSGVISLYTNGSERLVIAADGRVYGKALHNNAGAVTGTTNQYIASGTYTPTLTAGSNVSSASSGAAQWMRVGNVVTVSGFWFMTCTTPGAATTLGVSLPIASALTASSQLAGTAVGNTGATFGSMSGDATNDRATFNSTTTVTTPNNMFFTFTYQVL